MEKRRHAFSKTIQTQSRVSGVQTSGANTLDQFLICVLSSGPPPILPLLFAPLGASTSPRPPPAHPLLLAIPGPSTSPHALPALPLLLALPRPFRFTSRFPGPFAFPAPPALQLLPTLPRPFHFSSGSPGPPASPRAGSAAPTQGNMECLEPTN